MMEKRIFLKKYVYATYEDEFVFKKNDTITEDSFHNFYLNDVLLPESFNKVAKVAFKKATKVTDNDKTGKYIIIYGIKKKNYYHNPVLEEEDSADYDALDVYDVTVRKIFFDNENTEFIRNELRYLIAEEGGFISKKEAAAECHRLNLPIFHKAMGIV